MHCLLECKRVVNISPNHAIFKALGIRAWWCSHLVILSPEICGLFELLSPSPSGKPLNRALRTLADRITALGSPEIATTLARCALDTCLEVYASAAASAVAPAGASVIETAKCAATGPSALNQYVGFLDTSVSR